MNRTTGTGLLTLGIVLAVIGAIMRYAIRVHTSGFDIAVAGGILLIVGLVVVVISVAIIAFGGRTRSSIEESVHETPSGQVRRSEQDQWTA